MEKRILGRTGRAVSVVGLGTWQLGADWGEVGEKDALAVLDAAAATGTTFLDTADVYGDGRSERIIGQFLAGNPGAEFTVATKMGRRVAQDPGFFTLDNFRAWTDRSRANLGMDRLDLVQLYCPPTPVFSSDAVYDALDTLVAEGRIAAYGVSVETSPRLSARSHGLAPPPCRSSSTRSGASPWMRCCPRRTRPAWASSPASRSRRACCPAGTPMKLLRGRRPPHVQPARRGLRRRGDVLGRGLRHRRGRRPGVRRPGPGGRHSRPGRAALGDPAARRLDRDPGRGNPEQAEQNAAAAALPPFSDAGLAAIADLYDRRIRAQVHDRW